MKKSLSVLIALSCVGLVGCANQAERIKETKSGGPEAFFPSETGDVVIAKLVADCAERGHSPQNVTAHTVTCLIKPREGADMLAGIAYGYGSTVQWYVDYSVYPKDSGTNVVTRIHGEINQPMGRKQRLDGSNNDSFNQVQERLYAIGGK